METKMNSKNDNLAEVVRLAQGGDKAAFARLYSDVYEDLYRMAVFRLGNAQDAEDAVSETVMSAWRQIRRLRSAEAFRGWIFRILSNQCNGTLQKRYERDSHTASGEFERLLLDLPGDPGDFTEKVALEDLLSCLSEQEQEILGMYLYSGYGSREIAECLSLKPSTVRSKIRRALEKLKTALT